MHVVFLRYDSIADCLSGQCMQKYDVMMKTQQTTGEQRDYRVNDTKDPNNANGYIGLIVLYIFNDSN